MSDTFLERFEQRRRERLEADRSFDLAGETLTHKASVAPEVAMRLEQMRRQVAREVETLQAKIAAANGDGVDVTDLEISDEAMILAADETILSCLDPDSHEAWGRLRAPDAAYPFNFEEIMALADYLLGRVTGLPTNAPADSSAGRKSTGSKSKGRSPSTVRSRAASA